MEIEHSVATITKASACFDDSHLETGLPEHAEGMPW
jgi:hypothetical protein